MDENPYRAPKAVPPHPSYSYKTWALIGAVLGGLPHLLIMGYLFARDWNRGLFLLVSINWLFIFQAIAMSIGCAILGAALCAFVCFVFRAASRSV
jgi:hypothetical protein